MSVPDRIYPGEAIVLTNSFIRPEPDAYDVAGTTAVVTLKAPNGGALIQIASEDVTVTFTGTTTVNVAARYTIPRERTSGGIWGYSIVTTDPLNAAYDGTFKVEFGAAL
ncbi:MAG: hypothetical protein AB7O86_05835 [Porticoccaceae bacterium]